MRFYWKTSQCFFFCLIAFITLVIARVLQPGTIRLFPRKQLCPQDSVVSRWLPWFIMNSNFLVSRTFRLVITNTPRTAKVLGSNLTRVSSFSSGKCSGSKKFGSLFVCLCFVGVVPHLRIVFFSCKHFHCCKFSLLKIWPNFFSHRL